MSPGLDSGLDWTGLKSGLDWTGLDFFRGVIFLGGGWVVLFFLVCKKNRVFDLLVWVTGRESNRATNLRLEHRLKEK